MSEETKEMAVKKFFADGIGIYLCVEAFTFLLSKILESAWLNYASLVIIGIYIVWACTSIFSPKVKSIFELGKVELLFFQIVIPAVLSILIGVICVSVTGDVQKNFFENIKEWLRKNDNCLFLSIIFSILVLLCYFIAYERVKIREEIKPGPQSKEVQQDDIKLDGIVNGIESIKTILDKKSQVGYTATCIPVKYNKEHDTFVFALIKNISHERSQWMFPGSHVEVSNNQLKEMYDLTDISIVPGKIIEDKVKKEAGLMDLQFIDPYYERISFENTENGKERRSYPNTCYPAKAPVFNYLFRVSESAKCYANQNHRCHYDFTYIGEYNEINESEAEYDVVEVEFNRNKNFKEIPHTDAIAHITSKLGEQINKRVRERKAKKSRNQFSIPFDQLCLDSIPEMIYNAILFYSDYKKL